MAQLRITEVNFWRERLQGLLTERASAILAEHPEVSVVSEEARKKAEAEAPFRAELECVRALVFESKVMSARLNAAKNKLGSVVIGGYTAPGSQYPTRDAVQRAKNVIQERAVALTNQMMADTTHGRRVARLQKEAVDIEAKLYLLSGGDSLNNFVAQIMKLLEDV